MGNMNKKAAWIRQTLQALALCVAAYSSLALAAEQRHFASPAEGARALMKAIQSHDRVKIKRVLGPEGDMLVSSGDEVADKRDREAFIKAYRQRHKLVQDSDSQVTLVIGNNEWPLPIPLVKSGKGWYFDTDKGDDEILARRIGRNEISAVKVLLEIVDSQREYAALNRGSDGIPVYAERIISTSGKRDGLYWPTKGDEPLSPIGELVADAAVEGYTDPLQLTPYHGYLYRILASQGKDAPGGARDYVASGKMTGGFAVIAWPARYGASGVMTFIVSQDGKVYEKNLGEKTEELAAKIVSFNPEAGWKAVEVKED